MLLATPERQPWFQRGVDSGANAGETSGPPLDTFEARCSLLGMQDVHEPGSAPPPSLRAPLGGVIESVGPALKAHGEESEGDSTKLQTLLLPYSVGTYPAGDGDGDDRAELGQVPIGIKHQVSKKFQGNISKKLQGKFYV